MSPKKAGSTPAVLPAFDEQIKTVLDYYGDPAWLGAHSPLASIYFLGEAMRNQVLLATPLQRGQALQVAVDQATVALWGGALPKTLDEMCAALERERQEPGTLRFAYLVLEVRHFQRFLRPRSNQAIWEEYFLRSKSQHYRDYDLAVAQLGQALLKSLQPTLRLEAPTPPVQLLGYDAYLTQASESLEAGGSVAITGGSGMGKSALGATIAQQIQQGGQRAVFWYTLRPGLNDRLESILFALGHFLYAQGATTLWQVLLGGPSQDGPGPALVALRQDLADLRDRAPLLCFDELDYLARFNSEQINSAYVQIVEALDSVRTLAPLLLIGHYAILETDRTLTPPGFQPVQIAHLFAEAGLPINNAEAEQLFRYTQGNPRLIHFCRALYQSGEALAAFTQQNATVTGFYPVLYRLWRRLNPEERGLLQQLAVFNAPIAADLWPTQQPILQRLLHYRLMEADQRGGIEVVAILRKLIVQEVLSPEERIHLHQLAAIQRHAFGEYTAAAWHYCQANDSRTAITLWYPKMEGEIRRGQAAVAYALFQQIPNPGLPTAERKALALIQGELLRLRGDWEGGLGRLAVAPWSGVDEIDAKAEGLRAEFLAALGQTEGAIVAYDKAIATLARLQTRIVNWQRQRGNLHVRQANLSQAKHDAQLAEALALELHGTIKKEEGQLDEALLYYQKAALLAETLQELTHLARIERHILHIHGYRRNLPKVEEYARNAMNHFQAIHDLAHVAQVQYELGGVYIECGHFEQGIQQSLQALRFFERAKSPYHIANICVNLAQGYLGSGDLDACEQYAQLALEQEEPEAMPYAYWCLGKIKAHQGNLPHAYACFAEVIRNSAQQPYIVAFAYKEEALLHLQQKQQPEGVCSLQKALQLFEKLGIQEEVAAVEALLNETMV